MASRPLIGAIEAGGTKFVVAVGHDHNSIHAEARIDTRDPDTTLAEVGAFLDAKGPVAAIGIAAFGPLDLDRRSPGWGRITATTKPGWSGVDLVGRIAGRLGVPAGFDTDVNGAALGEWQSGAAQGCSVATYITIGTGIGGGTVVHGRPVHGLGHPELGHFRPCRHPGDLAFAGACPFHGDCLEGLASGPAIAARWGASLSELGADHPAQAIIADYLGQACVTLRAILAPEAIILGGGVMGTPGLLERVRAVAADYGGDYFPPPPDDTPPIIRAPGLGPRSGIAGAFALGRMAFGA